MIALLWMHSLLRWAILLFLIRNISNHFLEKDKPYSPNDKKWSLRLLIVTHLNFVVGLLQYFFGEKGFAYFKNNDAKTVMKTPALRFWAVEHITGMLLAVIFITVAHSLVKKYTITHNSKHNRVLLFCVLALVFILAVIPWPFREMFNGTPWIRGLY
ncbi:MAG: hypothetical protein NTZ59_14095 [Bacteroidetes bacterium]|nr:hypothetical protein [Bacteroidota bacterium]